SAIAQYFIKPKLFTNNSDAIEKPGFSLHYFSQKAGFSNAGLPCSAEASRRRACIHPAIHPAFINFPAYQRDSFMNNAGKMNAANLKHLLSHYIEFTQGN
ncbi:MAG: hypothetical protein KGY69_15085, partial [Bacteroidales bacterium]|nr:hypothetical protein [Bacteroidales bacterium]